MEKLLHGVFLIFLIGSAMAHAGSHSNLPEPGIKPGSIFYGLDRMYESASLALTFSEERKARKKLRFGQEKLSESASLVEENRTQKAAEAAELYTELMREASRLAAETGSEDLGEKIKATRRQNTDILNELSDRLPEKAAERVSTFSEL